MNIAILTNDGRIYCRPDTTWHRQDFDLYVPEGIKGLYWSFCAMARMSRAGKCIGEKFVSRYYDSFGYGLLLYDKEGLDRGDLGSSSCFNQTSVLHQPFFEAQEFTGKGDFSITLSPSDRKGSPLSGSIREETLLIKASCPTADIEKAVCSVSEKVLLRIGDFVCLETGAPFNLLPLEKGESARLTGAFDKEKIFDFNIIFGELI